MLEVLRNISYWREPKAIDHQPYKIAEIPPSTPMTTQPTAGTKSNLECQCMARSTPKKPPKARQRASATRRTALLKCLPALLGAEGICMKLLTLELSGGEAVRLERVVRPARQRTRAPKDTASR